MIKIIDFYAEWCSPCKTMSKVLDEFKSENKEVIIEKVDVEINPQLAKKYNIRAIPFLVINKNENIIYQAPGLISKEKIEDIIKNG